jgi:hypothetical protein
MQVKIEVIENFDYSGTDYKQVWDRLSNKNNPYANDFELYSRWYRFLGIIENNRIGYKKNFMLAVFRKDEDIIGLLPLVMVIRYKRKIFRIRSLELMMQSFGGPILDVIHDGLLVPEDIVNLVKILKRKYRFHYIHLAYLPENSIIRDAFPGMVRFHSRMPVIRMNRSYEELWNNAYSKNLKKKLNRFRNKLSGSRDEHIEQKVLTDKNEILNIKSKIIKVSNSKMKSPGMHSHYITEMGDPYFNMILNHANPFCSIILENEVLLAYIFGFFKSNLVYYNDGAYNRDSVDANKIGFGILALDNAVKHFCSNYEYFNLGHGTADYKMQFADDQMTTYQVKIQGNKLLNFIYKF